MTLYFGTVSCDLLRSCSSRARVSIPGTDGISLSVKASLNNYPRRLFKKGVTVEVEQNLCDRRKFRVTQVFEAVEKPVAVSCNFSVRVPCPADLGYGRKKDMEKVKFYLNSNYFDHPALFGVLSRVFNVTHKEYQMALGGGTGLTFICTTDQFTKFLIERNQNGIKNGFMDLGAKLVRPEPELDAYQALADIVGITRDQAKKVSLALLHGGGADEVRRRMDHQTPRDHARVMDVSDR